MSLRRKKLKLAVVAGETSGDHLGGALIRALHRQVEQLDTFGVTGESMRTAGCRSLDSIETLSVVGLAEVATQLPRLWRFSRCLERDILREGPDLVLGIDSPDFNLGLERRLRRAGLRTMHYVSPSVWAWRPGRAKAVARAAEAVLCLFPFEPEYYADQSIQAVYVGHPLADEIVSESREIARKNLNLPRGDSIVTLMPGSRIGEINRLGPLFYSVAAELVRSGNPVYFVVPAASKPLAEKLTSLLQASPGLPLSVVTGQTQRAVAAADVVLVASGTATLEVQLLGRPMVMAYRLAPVTAWILRSFRLVHSPYFALPNLIIGRGVVPELVQEEASIAKISTALLNLLASEEARNEQLSAFKSAHLRIGTGAADAAASAVLDIVDH